MKNKKKRIAFFLIGVNSKYCGGAERFFSSFFTLYNNHPQKKFELFFLIDQSTKDTLVEIGTIKKDQSYLLIMKNISNRFKTLIENTHLFFLILFKKISAVHVCSYTPYYYSKLRFLDRLPGFMRPKIIVNIVSARPAYSLINKNDPHYKKDHETYGKLFKEIKIDAILAWNKKFKESAQEFKFFNTAPYIEFIRSRYIDGGKYFPEEKKSNHIIYSGRLVEPKRPLFFLEGVKILISDFQFPVGDWKFYIYGKGEQMDLIKEKIIEWKLEKHVFLGDSISMDKVLNTSKCYVSTQDYDNFPSLAINEAMSSGNAIIARNIGQTSWFVKDGVNGLLLKNDSPSGLAEILKEYLLHPERHSGMSEQSAEIVRLEHTAEKFISQIESFWEKALS